MNYAIVFRLLGYVMLIEGALLLLPAAASWIYGEWFVLGVFLITAAVSAAIGYALRGIKPKSKMFYMREGFASTSLSWIVISIVGAVPFVVTGCIPNPVDALFETVSGFTTTGASILPGVEDLPKGILFWRSFTHWIGGMGVLVFLLSLLPLTGGSHVNLMKAESPGPQVDKLVPKVQSTAKILYGIYFALTVLELVFLMLGGMPLFESMLTAFGTAGTGGFGFKNDSFTSFSPYIQWVVTILSTSMPTSCCCCVNSTASSAKRCAATSPLFWWQLALSRPISTACITAVAKRCVRQPFRWVPSSPLPVFPAVILTCGPPSPKKFWWCSCSLVPARAAPAAASR